MVIRQFLTGGYFDALGPEFLWIETTNRCASHCTICNIWRQEPEQNALTALEIENMLRDPLFRRLRILVLSGGEPTLRTDLKAILAGVRRARPRVGIVLSTNGMQPERLLDTVSFALSQKMNIEVGVSLDGVGETHDQTRGIPGLFARVDATLLELVRLKHRHGRSLRITVGFTLTDQSAARMQEVHRYAESMGIAFNVQWYNQAAYYGNVGRDQLRERAKLFAAACHAPPSPLRDQALRVLEGKQTHFTCSSLRNFCLLRCNGDLVPCFQLWNAAIGNIRCRAPHVIWKSEQARQARKDIMSCAGCLNACGVLWSHRANHLAMLRFYLSHPLVLSNKMRQGWWR